MRGSDKNIPLNKAMNTEWTRGLLRGTPDIRAEVVANLRTQILRRTYKVEAELVVEKIVQNACIFFSLPEKKIRSNEKTAQEIIRP